MGSINWDYDSVGSASGGGWFLGLLLLVGILVAPKATAKVVFGLLFMALWMFGIPLGLAVALSAPLKKIGLSGGWSLITLPVWFWLTIRNDFWWKIVDWVMNRRSRGETGSQPDKPDDLR